MEQNKAMACLWLARAIRFACYGIAPGFIFGIAAASQSHYDSDWVLPFVCAPLGALITAGVPLTFMCWFTFLVMVQQLGAAIRG